jgi:3-methyladenine DNA glycosylase AlkD
VVHDAVIDDLARRLGKRADERTRDWWNGYLKGAIEFRGVPMRGVRDVVHAVWSERALDDRPREEQFDIVLALFAQPYAEDKLAAILALGERLIAGLTAADVPLLGEPFARGHIADWSTCDWYCVKVLARLLERAPDAPDAAEAIAAWRSSPGLWQRRAAAVSFVTLARHGDARLPNLTKLVLDVCAVNVRDPERFSQTSAGWVLRELSRADRGIVTAFVEQHADTMSAEARRMATAKMRGRGRR